MQTLLVGDIHGCFDELIELIDKAGLNSGDRIVSVGDFVDRGPKTPEVVRFMQHGTQDGNKLQVLAIKGNHEHKHLRASKGEVKLALSQEIASEQLGAEYPDAIHFFDSLPYYLELPEVIVVHGGLDPDPKVQLKDQLPDILTGTQRGEELLKKQYARRWYELYEGPKPVVFGHKDIHNNGQPYVFRDTAIGLDTSCVFGWRLTGLLLPSHTFVSVPSRGNHWAQLKKQYLPPRDPRPPPPPEPPWDEPDEQLLAAVMGWAKNTNDSVLLKLQLDTNRGRLTDREEALAYNSTFQGHPAIKLLHLARTNKLVSSLAKKALKTPDGLHQLAAQLGL